MWRLGAQVTDPLVHTEHELVFLTTQCEGPHATWVRCPGAEARLDHIACDMRMAKQASWCGMKVASTLQ